jgi:hypothetical protein
MQNHFCANQLPDISSYYYKGVGTLTHYATLALDSLPCVISKAHAKMILLSHLGITNHLTRAFLLIIYMVRIVQIQVADNFAKRPVAANS